MPSQSSSAPSQRDAVPSFTAATQPSSTRASGGQTDMTIMPESTPESTPESMTGGGPASRIVRAAAGEDDCQP